MPNQNINVRSILLLRFSSMGDLILMSPLLDHLKEFFPQAKITFVTREDLRSVYEHHPGISEILTVSRRDGFAGLWRLYKTLKSQKWDMIYDAHGSLRSLFLRILLKAKIKLHINKRTWQRLLLIFFKARVLAFHYFKDQFSYPLKKLGLQPQPRPTVIFRSEREVSSINQKWNFQRDRSVIGIVPSAQWEGKRWPIEHFQTLIQKLNENYHIAIFGGPEDSFCQSLIQESQGHAINFQGKLTLLETFEALSRCQLVVANDTGLMHAAEAVGTDVVALLGPTGEEFGFIPYRAQSDFLTTNHWCRPCSKNGQGFCIRQGRRLCLSELSVDSVFESIHNYFYRSPHHVSAH